MEISYVSDLSHWSTYVLAAQKNMRRAAKGSGYGTMMMWLVLVLAFVVAGPWLVARGFDMRHALSFAIGSLGAWLLLTYYLMQWQKFASNKSVRPEGVVLGPRTLKLDVDGIVVRGQMHEERYSWKVVQGTEIVDDVLIIWFEPILGLFIPKAAFGGDGGLSAAIEMITDHAAGASLKTP